MGLDRSDSPSFEPNGGVKGGSAAAQRFTLDAAIGFKHHYPSDQGPAPKRPNICVRDVSERHQIPSDMSPGYTLVPAIHVFLGLSGFWSKDVDARDKRGRDDREGDLCVTPRSRRSP
ncbi:MAG: hypothetical protein ACJ8EU_22230 [Xanthobacteraceae bacterium]